MIAIIYWRQSIKFSNITIFNVKFNTEVLMMENSLLKNFFFLILLDQLKLLNRIILFLNTIIA